MIDILMATYNGEKYLRPQLDSILRQSNTDWRLVIRDDCSTDSTVQIIQEYREKYPDKFVLLQADEPSGFAQNNFFQLIKYWQHYSTANYIMFADQDDVWLPPKIQLTLDKMRELENQYGNDTPLLVHTDLSVVDADLNIINPSMFAMQNMDARRDKLNNILVQNIVTGCTMMVNKRLLDMVTDIPQHAVMHDMWLALIASAFGHIGFVEKATILYRQHDSNSNGVKSLMYYILNLKSENKNIISGQKNKYRQAENFLHMYEAKLNTKQQELLTAYGGLESKNFIKRAVVLTKYRLYKKGFVRKLGQILL